MILLRNTQRSVKINQSEILRDVERVLLLLDYVDYDLGIWITNNRTIRKFNKLYRHKNKPTDILSFPYHESLKPGERIELKNTEDKNLGDLILSAEYILASSKEEKIPFKEHLRRLLVHGICHLLGYDHINDDDYRRMRAKETYLLKKLALVDA